MVEEKKEEKIESLLNPNQEYFCRLYASSEEFFGNGVKSYTTAYNLTPEQYTTAKTNASVLLSNPIILKRVNALMDIKINNETVDKELGFVVLQKVDFGAKVAAIREWNKLKSRITDKIENTVKVENTLSDIQITELLKRRKEVKEEVSTKPEEPKK